MKQKLRDFVIALFFIYARAYYFLTAYLPRRLPIDTQDWVRLKAILAEFYGVTDQPEFWATVAGHVASTPSYMSRRSYAFLSTVAKRLTVNAAAQQVRVQAGRELEARLAEAVKKEAMKPEIVNAPEAV